MLKEKNEMKRIRKNHTHVKKVGHTSILAFIDELEKHFFI